MLTQKNFPEKGVFLLLLILFSFHLAFMWPGELSPDSQGQYAAAVAGIYSDHHPFIMSFVWRYLDKIYEGPGLMLVLHLGLLYSAVLFLMRSVDKNRFIFLALPLVPHVATYSGMIWKDVGFAYAFLWVGALLTYLLMREKSLRFGGMLGTLIILMYGTLVKFQAQYLAPIFLLWIAFHRAHYVSNLLHVMRHLVLTCALFYGMIAGMNYFGPKVEENHSWQLVKLYDLSALSVYTKTSLFPEFTKTEKFSMEELARRFNHQRVDDLVFADPILKGGTTEEERTILWNTWAKEVLRHPFLYGMHRAANLGYALLSMPGFTKIIELNKKIAQPEETILLKTMYVLERAVGGMLLAHLLPMVGSVLYLFLAILCMSTSREAIPLFFINAVGVGMGAVLFFFSMAGAPRYTYVMVCMFHASHLFAYRCWKNWRAIK